MLTCWTGMRSIYYIVTSIDANVILMDRNSANLTPVNSGWAGQGVTTPNAHQLWKFVRACD